VRRTAFAALAALALVVACSSVPNGQCDCIDPSLRVSVPIESAAAVSEVRLSGSGCTGAQIVCAQEGTGGCATWRFAANGAGTCHIEVLFKVGTTYTRDVTIAQTTGCCAGLYPTPENAGEIDVTVPPGAPADDAGGAPDAGESDAGATDGAKGDAESSDAGSDV
jgi:hypothetical protein